MIRVVVENVLLFLLPTFVYVAWQLTMHRTARNKGAAPPTPGAVMNDAPLLWLFAGGAILVVVTLIAFGSTSGGKPGQHYEPSSIKDGRIQPGHIE